MSQFVGILNITPDSFSDGGEFFNKSAAIERFLKLVEQGFSVIDIGPQSTRPGAYKITAKTEITRLNSILPFLPKTNVQISLDSFYPEVIKYFIKHIDIINDVSSANNPAMINIAREYSLPIIAMHSISIPADPNITISDDKNAVEEIISWANKKISFLEKQGIKKVIIDPGIGFGKSHKQSWEIVNKASILKDRINAKIMIGHSRKGFLKQKKYSPQYRVYDKDCLDEATKEVTKSLLKANIDYIRLHSM